MKRITSTRRPLAACLLCLSSLAGLLTSAAPASAGGPNATPEGPWVTDDVELCDLDQLDISMQKGQVFIYIDDRWVWVPEQYEIVLGFEDRAVTTINFVFDEPTQLSVAVDGGLIAWVAVNATQALHSVSNNLSTYIYTVAPARGAADNILPATNTKVTIQSNDTCPPPDYELPIDL